MTRLVIGPLSPSLTLLLASAFIARKPYHSYANFRRDSLRVKPNRYPGARLRHIRAEGQFRECARRRARGCVQ